MEQEDRKISRFSSGLNILMRLDNLWKDTHKHSREGRFQMWNDDLDRIWLELARDLKQEEYYDLDKDGSTIIISEKEVFKKGYKSQFEAFDEKLEEIMPFMDSGTTGFQKPNDDVKKNRNKQYKVLMEKQLFLARLENELGKGTTYEDEDDDF